MTWLGSLGVQRNYQDVKSCSGYRRVRPGVERGHLGLSVKGVSFSTWGPSGVQVGQNAVGLGHGYHSGFPELGTLLQGGAREGRHSHFPGEPSTGAAE